VSGSIRPLQSPVLIAKVKDILFTYDIANIPFTKNV